MIAVDDDTVREALDGVDDPEYPGISIAELGLVADIRVDDGSVEVDLIPTFTGCPALAMIVADVETALRRVAGVGDVTVRFVDSPVWSPSRISPSARRRIGREFTVAVHVPSSPATCPRCGGQLVVASMFGPTRCRDLRRCVACDEWIETIR